MINSLPKSTRKGPVIEFARHVRTENRSNALTQKGVARQKMLVTLKKPSTTKNVEGYVAPAK
jgi:hypothetical protein